MNAEDSKAKVGPGWWARQWASLTENIPRTRAGWLARLRKPKSGRDREFENGWAGLAGLVELMVASAGVFVMALTISMVMIPVAVAYFSHPGLVEWIGALLAQNCIVNHVCSFGTNIAAFAVANLILAELVVSGCIMFLRAGDPDSDDDVADSISQLDQSLMAVMGEVGDLRDQVEGLRHERVPLPPMAAPPDGAHADEQPY